MSVGHWLLDRIRPTLEGSAITSTPSNPQLSPGVAKDVIPLIHARLVEEMAAETDRRHSIESKLVAVSSVSPIAVTLMSALVAFLTSGRVGNFTRPSVIGLSIVGLYVSTQFLLATLAAVRGLSRTSYSAPQVTGLLSDATGSTDAYLSARATELASRIEQHREATNDRVSQLALAHASMINAVAGLIIGAAVLLVITILGAPH